MSNVFGMADNQNSTVAITFEDAAGNVVPNAIDAGSLVVTASDPAAVAVTIATDQNSFDCAAEGPLDADVVVSVSCTVAGEAFSGSVTFAVGAGAPTQLVLTPGAPVAN